MARLKAESDKHTWKTKAGDIIDEQVAEQLAEEAERGYDPDELVYQPIGRPSLGANGTSPRIGFRIAPERYLEARERAEREGRTVSEIAREALNAYLDGPGAPDGPDDSPGGDQDGR